MDLAVSLLKELTAKQQKFADGVVSGLNQSDAYRKAYDTSNWSPEAIHQQASTMMEHPQILLMVQTLKQAIVEQATTAQAWNLDKQIRESATNVQLGRDLGQIGASNGALTNIGKLTGLLVDRHEVKNLHLHAFADVSTEQLEAWANEVLEAADEQDG